MNPDKHVEPPEQYGYSDPREGEFKAQIRTSDYLPIELNQDDRAKLELALAQLWDEQELRSTQDAELDQELKHDQEAPASSRYKDVEEFRAYMARLQAAEASLPVIDNQTPVVEPRTREMHGKGTAAVNNEQALASRVSDVFDLEHTQLQSAIDLLSTRQWLKLSKYTHQLIDSMVNHLFDEDKLDSEKERAIAAGMILAQTTEIAEVYLDDLMKKITDEVIAKTGQTIPVEQALLTCRQLLLQEVDAVQ